MVIIWLLLLHYYWLASPFPSLLTDTQWGLPNKYWTVETTETFAYKCTSASNALIWFHWQTQLSGRSVVANCVRPTTRWRDYLSHLVWKHLRFPPPQQSWTMQLELRCCPHNSELDEQQAPSRKPANFHKWILCVHVHGKMVLLSAARIKTRIVLHSSIV